MIQEMLRAEEPGVKLEIAENRAMRCSGHEKASLSSETPFTALFKVLSFKSRSEAIRAGKSRQY